MRAFLAGLAFALVLAACSGDDDDEGLTKAEFIKQADAICAKHNETQNKIGDNISATATAEETAKVYIEQVIPDVRMQQRELRALAAPKADRETIDSLFDDVDATLEQVEKDLKEHPEETLGSATSPFADVNARAKAYGFVDCSEG